MHSCSTFNLSQHVFRNLRTATGVNAFVVLRNGGVGIFDSITSISQPLQLGGVRFKFSKRINDKETRRFDTENEGIHYHGFTYFPRYPDQKDPPVEPTKLFLVKRIRSLYGCPWWEKKMIEKLKLDARRTIAIVKNTPENNKLLYKVKHLIEIIPINTPYGMPDSPENAFLKENGDFISFNELSPFGDVSVEDAQKFKEEQKKKFIDYDRDTLQTRLNKRWYSRFDVI